MLYFDARRWILVSHSDRKSIIFLNCCLLLVCFSLPSLLRAAEGERISVLIASKGKLLLNPDGRKTRQLPFEVNGKLVMNQRKLDSLQDRPRWIRHFSTAYANIRIGGSTARKSQLPSDRRIFVCQRRPDRLLLFSPHGPLTRAQLDLVQVPGDPNELQGVLSDLKTDKSRWQPRTAKEKKHVARMFYLDAINQTSLTGEVKKRTASLMQVKIVGTVSGAVRGVATELDIQATLEWDTNRASLQQATWVIKEKRAIGHAEPGFESTTEIQMKSSPADGSDTLGDSQVSGLPLDYRRAATVLRFQSPHVAVQMLADREWITMVDRPEVMIMRLVNRGDLTAQCNVSSLPDLKPGKHLALKSFQSDIRTSLGKQFAQFVSAEQFVTSHKLRVLRVVAIGRSSSLPIQWNYYHLSNDQGRRAALVFTMESKLVKRFAARDRSMIDTFQFLRRPAPARAKVK